ncbi:MAG: lysylphosphatidylglycerol synthase transmembrane domain-containing protein [Actinomycetes bacterium]
MAADGVDTPDILQTQKPSPIHSAVRVALSALLIALIFGFLIPSFADYSKVWDTITSLTVAELTLLTGLTLLVELGKAGPYAVQLDGIGLGKAFLVQESAAVVSNLVPGPSGTAAKYVAYRKFGVSNEAFGRAVVVNAAWSNVIPLVLPAVAITLLAVQTTIPGDVLLLAVGGLVASALLILLTVKIMRSEDFAYRFGERLGRILNWARGVVRRPPAESVGQAVVGFRLQVLDDVRAHWLGLTGFVLMKECATALVLLTSLRALDEGRASITVIEVFAVYAVVRLLTLVEITPGNVGLAETLYISALMYATDGADENVIVAAVFVFRMFTYLGPIVAGGVCWLALTRYFRGHDRSPVPAQRSPGDDTEPHEPTQPREPSTHRQDGST